MGTEKSRTISVLKGYQIVHYSYVDIIALIKSLPMWLNKMEYYFYEKGLGEKDIGTGHFLESEWVATRKVTEYIMFTIEVSIVAKDIKKVVMDDGSEAYWARLMITVNATLTKDYQNKYKTIWYEEMKRQLYEKYIVKEEIKKYVEKLQAEAMDLVGTMKGCLK